jgi:hypothetical protein
VCFFNPVTGQQKILRYITFTIKLFKIINQFIALSCFTLSSLMCLFFCNREMLLKLLSNLNFYLPPLCYFLKAKLCLSFFLVRMFEVIKEPSSKALRDWLKAFSVYFLLVYTSLCGDQAHKFPLPFFLKGNLLAKKLLKNAK